jgi:hypothetical protein
MLAACNGMFNIMGALGKRGKVNNNISMAFTLARVVT